MLYAVRQLLSIALLPGTVTLVVPWWLARRNATTIAVATDAVGVAVQLAGIIVLIVGLTLFGTSLRRFVVEGRGTLAPWDPPRRLVLRGPYRYVRHPMISGVIFILIGEALVLRSLPHGLWALTFLAINAVYLPLIEEPMLIVRFGDDYREYRRHVPGLVPRLRPWSPPDGPAT